jgi:hypothetical protein
MKVWLITKIDAKKEESVVCILNSKLTYDNIAKLLTIIHINIVVNNLEDTLYFAKKPEEYPYIAKPLRIKGVPCHFILSCGHNPMACAQLVNEVSVENIKKEKILKFKKAVMDKNFDVGVTYVSRPKKYEKKYSFIKI